MINLERFWYKILGYKLFEINREKGKGTRFNCEVGTYLFKIIRKKKRCEMWIKQVRSL
jgi:hypothetical protein